MAHGAAEWLSYAALLYFSCCAALAAAQDPAGIGTAEAEQGTETEPEIDNSYWIFVHGVLMSIGWVALLPVGAFIAQSRWMQTMKSQVGSKAAWFWLHVALQVAGVALVVAAFGIAYSDSTGMEPDRSETLGYAHKVIGTIAFAFLMLQTVATMVKPAPTAPRRGLWNHVHHNTGRLAVLLAWVNIWLGVTFYREEGSMRNGFLAWVVPLAVFQGLLAITYAVGFLAAPSPVSGPEEKPLQTAHTTGAPAGPQVQAAHV